MKKISIVMLKRSLSLTIIGPKFPNGQRRLVLHGDVGCLDDLFVQALNVL